MIIPDVNTLNCGPKRGPLYIKKQFPDFYDFLITNYPGYKFSEALYVHYFGEPNLCPTCGQRPSFISFTKGYSKYCSTKCANSNKSKIEGQLKTCNEKYGGAGFASSGLLTKSIHTTIARHGADYRKKAKEKRTQTNKEKYGTEYSLQSPIVREKIRQTCQEKYGVDNVLLVPEIASKVKQAFVSKYGSDNPMDIPELVEKLKYSNQRKHGYDFPFQDPLIQKKCVSKKGKTDIEKFIEDILVSHNIDHTDEDEHVLPGCRVDFNIQSKHLIIECNGIYWHSDLMKGQQYHIRRAKIAEENGYQMLTFWADQIHTHPEIVKSIVLSKLGIYDQKFGARQCKIKEITSKSCNKFLDNNHIQGRTSANIHYGAFHNDELVGVMTFVKSRGCQGSKTNRDNQWELNRFCSKLNTQIHGLASKFIKKFIKQYNPSSIVSFSHNDISNGNLYEKLGFITDNVTKHSYYYVKGDKRYHRSTFTKAAIVKRGWKDKVDNTWSESEVMGEHNYYCIHDSGTKKWIKTI